MLLKKLYLYKNRIWLRRVKNERCYNVCDFYGYFYGYPREERERLGGGGCMSGVCLEILRKLQDKIPSGLSHRYIPVHRYFEEYRQAYASKEI